MNGKRKKTRNNGKTGRIILCFILLLLLSGTVALRVMQADRTDKEGEQPAPSAAPAQPAASPVVEENSPAPVPEQTAEPVTERMEETTAVQTPAPSVAVNSIPAQPDPGGKEHYTAETYKMVTDLVYAYRHLGAEGWTQVEGTLAQLNAADPKLGVLWDGIMRKWAYVREDMVLKPGVLPDGLPQDDTLCIAVMGHQLLPDGRMDAEMQKRCEIGLSMVQKYPNAFLAVTGGGTASANNEVTEAETMAEWFLRQGVSPDRMIVEKASNPQRYSSNYDSVLNTACAVVRMFRYDHFKEEWSMVLEEDNKDRSYLFGRLLAVLEKVERDTYGSDEVYQIV